LSQKHLSISLEWLSYSAFGELNRTSSDFVELSFPHAGSLGRLGVLADLSQPPSNRLRHPKLSSTLSVQHAGEVLSITASASAVTNSVASFRIGILTAWKFTRGYSPIGTKIHQDSDWSILLLVNHYLELKMADLVELWLCWASLVSFTGAQRHHRLAKSEPP
jgi:hypothetical protein